jgi:hypothetical protein
LDLKRFIFTYPQRTLKLKEKPSALKREHPAFQNMKILLDPDPDPEVQINADPQLWFYFLNFSAPLESPRSFI